MGASDRRSAFHTPTIATIGVDGRPRLRTVVLRAVDAAARSLRFHTDRRSEKITELAREPRTAAHFYDPAAKIQVRVEGTAQVHGGDEVALGAWQSSQRMSRICYGTAPGPGTRIPTGDGFTLPSAAPEIDAGQENFVAVVVRALRVEWLYLDHLGHRRAIFDETDGTRSWLAP
jgi:hypothetical protein